MRSRVLKLVATSLAFAATLVGPSAQSTSADEGARVRYENAKKQMSRGDYKEALSNLDEAATMFTSSRWAGEALVLKTEYVLEVTRDFSQAKKDLDRIKGYRDVAAAAYLLTGRIALAEERTKTSIASAAAKFNNAYDYYKDSPYVAEGRYREGEALRLNGQIEEAIEKFQGLALSDPRSIWTARALLQLAVCLTYRNRWQEAFSALQRVSVDFENKLEAAPELQTAINLNTILYRLYIRKPPDQSPFKYASTKQIAPSVRFEDVSAMTVLPNDTLVVVDKGALVMVDVNGELLPSVRAQEATAVAGRRRMESYAVSFKQDDTPAFLAQKSLFSTGQSGVLLKIPDSPDKTKPVEKASALIQNWKREWLVGDPGAKAIWVYNEKGEFVRSFTGNSLNISPDRLAMNGNDEIAALDAGRKTITLLDRDGHVRKTIEPTGQNYKFERPVDLAFDPFGHLYVLDRGKGEVVVFAPEWTPLPRVQTVFTGPATERDPGFFRKAAAFGIDSRGRMFIFDEGAKRIQVYQ